jgi:hypothetical protein
MGEVDEPQPIRWERLTNRDQSDENCSVKCTGHSHVAARPRCEHGDDPRCNLPRGRLEMQSRRRDDSRCNLPRGTTRDAISREGSGRLETRPARRSPGTAPVVGGLQAPIPAPNCTRRAQAPRWARACRRPNVHGEPGRRDGHVHASTGPARRHAIGCTRSPRSQAP